MKKALTSSPVLHFPDFNLPFYIQSDASDKGFGAVLGQMRNGSEVVVAYASKAIGSSQVNWSTIEKEAFAIVWSVKYFRHYLYGRSFTIYTDHNPLKWLFTLKSPEGRLALWTETLKAYNFKVEYRVLSGIVGHRVLWDIIKKMNLGGLGMREKGVNFT